MASILEETSPVETQADAPVATPELSEQERRELAAKQQELSLKLELADSIAHFGETIRTIEHHSH